MGNSNSGGSGQRRHHGAGQTAPPSGSVPPHLANQFQGNTPPETAGPVPDSAAGSNSNPQGPGANNDAAAGGAQNQPRRHRHHGYGVPVQEGERVKMLATVDANTVRFNPESSTLTFHVTSDVASLTYEIHTGVRETVKGGKVYYTPNKPKLEPVRVTLEGKTDRSEIVEQIDMEKLDAPERAYNKSYPKQRPCVIVIRYSDEFGEHTEHTSVNLAVSKTARCAVDQIVTTKGSAYVVENLFGAEHQGEMVVASSNPTNGTEGGGEGGSGGAQVTMGAIMGDGDDDNDLCVICLTNPKDTAVMPCRHLCLCKECAEELQMRSPRCPVCRGPISTLLHMASSS